MATTAAQLAINAKQPPHRKPQSRIHFASKASYLCLLPGSQRQHQLGPSPCTKTALYTDGWLLRVHMIGWLLRVHMAAAYTDGCYWLLRVHMIVSIMHTQCATHSTSCCTSKSGDPCSMLHQQPNGGKTVRACAARYSAVKIVGTSNQLVVARILIHWLLNCHLDQ